MTARSQMRMRAFLQRDENAGTLDAHNNPVPPSWVAQETLPCRAWSTSEVEVRDGTKIANLADVLVNVPIDADVLKGDRIEKIVDRVEAVTPTTGRVWFADPLDIETIEVMKSHQKLFCTVVK